MVYYRRVMDGQLWNVRNTLLFKPAFKYVHIVVYLC